METKVTTAHVEGALAKAMWLHDFRVALWFEVYDGYDRQERADVEKIRVAKVRQISETSKRHGLVVEMSTGEVFQIALGAVTR